MAIRDAAIYREVMEIITGRADVSDTRFKYTLEIIALDSSIIARKVHVVDITRDFISRVSDYLIITASVNQLEYDELIYRGREDLKARLTVESVNDKTGISGGERASKLYRAKLTKVEDDKLIYGDSSSPDNNSKGMEIKDFALQLYDLELEKLKVKEISTVIRDTNVDDILHIVMSDFGKLVVDIHPPARKSPLAQTILPEGDVPIIEFPAWLQRYGGGVYEHNIGVFHYNDVVYVYPLFDTRQYPDRRKVIICSVGPAQLEGVDNTYHVEPGKLSILTTGKVDMIDTTESLEYELGNAVRFTTPNFISDAIEHSNGVTTATGSGYNEHGEHKETINKSTVGKLVTNNPFYEVSRIASNRGVRATLPWANANPALIYPNMEVTVLYKSGDDVHSMRGVVVGMDYQSSAGENEGIEGTHQGEAKLHLYLEKDYK